MKKRLIRFFGLPGSWKWACRQLDKGLIVRRSTDSGEAKYKLDRENQRRIQWSFRRLPDDTQWEDANIFLSDFECTDWVVWDA